MRRIVAVEEANHMATLDSPDFVASGAVNARSSTTNFVVIDFAEKGMPEAGEILARAGSPV